MTKTVTDSLVFLNAHPFVRATVLDRIHGCITGSAIGDTIGLYTEFMTKEESEKAYPEADFTIGSGNPNATELHPDTHRTRFAPNAWTEDTDQALLIVLSYLHNFTQAPSRSNSATHARDALSSDFAARLQIWISQGLLALNCTACGIGALVGEVVGNSNYTTDPIDIATKAWIRSGHKAAPNGSLMRTHPIGIIGMGLTKEQTCELSIDVGLLRGEIFVEKDVNDCIERCYEWVKGRDDLMNPGNEDLRTQLIEKLLDRDDFTRYVHEDSLLAPYLDEPDKIGYAYKCIGSAILSLRRAMRKVKDYDPVEHENIFEELTIDMVMEGGDADTNGAAACAVFLTTSEIPTTRHVPSLQPPLSNPLN